MKSASGMASPVLCSSDICIIGGEECQCNKLVKLWIQHCCWQKPFHTWSWHPFSTGKLGRGKLHHKAGLPHHSLWVLPYTDAPSMVSIESGGRNGYVWGRDIFPCGQVSLSVITSPVSVVCLLDPTIGLVPDSGLAVLKIPFRKGNPGSWRWQRPKWIMPFYKNVFLKIILKHICDIFNSWIAH